MADDDFASFMNDQAAARSKRLRRGERVTGTVLHITGDSVFVDIGTRADGRIPRVELLRHDGTLQVAEGGSIEATVVDPDAPDGPLLAVVLGREGGVDVEGLTLACETGTVVEGTFTKAVKAGLEVDLAGVRAFCPASQVDVGFVSDLSSYVGQPARVLVIEVRDDGRSVVVSRRRVLEREKTERAAEALDRLEEGQVLEGEVSSIQSYGAFVDLDGVEGLIHISELSAQRVGSVEDVVSVGERVRVKVLAIEPGKDGPRIRLSMKALQQQQALPEPKPDEVLNAEIVRHLPHGVIVKTPNGEGLVPVRELNLPHGSDHRRAYSVGDTLEVVRLDGRAGKLRFSERGVEEVRAQSAFRDYKKQAGHATSAGQGAMADQLSKLKLGDLPQGPPPAPPEPKPKPAPAPAPEAAPAPEPSVPAAGTAEASGAPKGDDATPEQAQAAEEAPKKRRRRIVSGRGAD